MPTTQDPPKSNARRAAERICRGLRTGHKIEVPGLAEDIERAINQESTRVIAALRMGATMAQNLASDLEQRRTIHHSNCAQNLRSCAATFTAAIAGMEGEAA